MLETGQPLHAFDAAKLRGDCISIRRAQTGEILTTLDGQNRKLEMDHLLIADSEGPVALAGVMGGLSTEVTEATSEILLESANFSQTTIRRTSRGLGLRSEASRRFEQRLSPETTVKALRRAVQLAEQMGAAKGVALWEDAYPNPAKISPINFPLGEIPRLLGIDFAAHDVRDVLSRAGFAVESSGENSFRVTPPYWRGDVTMKADLVEEVVTILGYDAIPSILPTGQVADVVAGELDWREEVLRDVVAAAGFQEAITYTITSMDRMGVLGSAPVDSKDSDDLGREVDALLLSTSVVPIELINPLRSEQNVMRTTALPSLLETLSDNLRFGDRDMALFEIGPIFLPQIGDLPDERRVFTAVSGARWSEVGWNVAGDVDFFAMKGVAEIIAERLGTPDLDFKRFRHSAFRTGSSAAIMAKDLLIGAVGEVSPQTRDASNIDETAWALILDLSRTFYAANSVRQYEKLPRFPAIVQDLSIVVDIDAPSGDIVETIHQSGTNLIDNIQLIDQYRGEQVPKGKRGLTYSITYRSATRTLVDDDAASIHDRILKALQGRFGAMLRE